MPNIIDVEGLSQENIKLIQELVEDLRAEEKIRNTKAGEEAVFAAWPLGAKGKLSRTEIYDYL